MDLATLLAVLRRRVRVWLSIFVLGIAGAVAITLAQSPKYTATVQLFVSTGSEGSVSSLAEGNSFVQARVQSYADIVSSPAVLAPVIEKLSLPETTDQLAAEVVATAPLNKVLIELSVSQPSATKAAEVANAIASSFSTVVSELDTTDSQSVVKLTVTQPASAPTAPSSPNVALNLLLGAAVGLLLGVVCAFVRNSLDTRVKSQADLESFDVPVVAVVPLDKRAPQNPIAFRGDGRSSRAEAFRLLRAQVHFLTAGQTSSVLAVMSSSPQEGKTHTAMNLAAAFAEAGQRVCLVEADLRRPTIAKAVGLVSEVGLTSVLVSDATIEDVVQNAGMNLAVMTSGPIPPNPSELLGSAQMTEVIAYLRSVVDVVVIDTAPLLAVADGLQVAGLVDARLMAVRSGKTKRAEIASSLDRLGTSGFAADGLILGFDSMRRSQDYYYYNTENADRGTGDMSASHGGEAEITSNETNSSEAAPTLKT